MIETWYVLETGDVADPRDIVHGIDPLKHKDGRPVAIRSDGVTPRSRGVDPVAERARAALMAGKISINEARAVVGKSPIVAAKEVKPAAQARGYHTREAKAG